MRTLAWDEPLVWVTWKVVAVPAGASFHETVLAPGDFSR